MGWDICYLDRTKTDVVSRLLREYGDKVVKYKSTLSGLWMVYRCEDGVLRIFLDLIEKHGQEFAVKNMSASMGPNYFDCPLSFLELAPESGECYWVEWSEGVKRFHARKKHGCFPLG